MSYDPEYVPIYQNLVLIRDTLQNQKEVLEGSNDYPSSILEEVAGIVKSLQDAYDRIDRIIPSDLPLNPIITGSYDQVVYGTYIGAANGSFHIQCPNCKHISRVPNKLSIEMIITKWYFKDLEDGSDHRFTPCRRGLTFRCFNFSCAVEIFFKEFLDLQEDMKYKGLFGNQTTWRPKYDNVDYNPYTFDARPYYWSSNPEEHKNTCYQYAPNAIEQPIERAPDAVVEQPIERAPDAVVEQPIEQPVEQPIERAPDAVVEQPIEHAPDAVIDQLFNKLIEPTHSLPDKQKHKHKRTRTHRKKTAKPDEECKYTHQLVDSGLKMKNSPKKIFINVSKNSFCQDGAACLNPECMLVHSCINGLSCSNDDCVFIHPGHGRWINILCNGENCDIGCNLYHI